MTVPLDGDDPVSMVSSRPEPVPSTDSGVGLDLVMTYAGEVVIMVGGLVTFHFVASHYGPHGFGHYQLARGLISLVAPVAGLGLATSFLKYLPGLARSRQVFVRLTVAHATVLAVLCAGLAVVSQVVDVGFGLFSGDLAVSAYALAAAMTVLTLVLSGLRGVAMPMRSVLLGSLGLGLAPLVAVAVSGSLVVMFWVQAALLFVLMAVAVAGCREPAAARSAGDGDTRGVREMLRYGVSRIPGDTALPLVFVLPTLYVGSAATSTEAGYIGFATSVVLLGCSGLATLTPILLPRFSGALARGDSPSRRWRVLGPVVVTIAAAVCTLLGELLATWVVGWYLGPRFESGASVVRVCLLAAVPLSLFYYSRVVLDAIYSYAWSARVAFLGFCAGVAVGLVWSLSGDALGAAQAAFVASGVVMGLGTVYSLTKVRS